MEVLQDFDFDSFLHQDGDAEDKFNFDTSGFGMDAPIKYTPVTGRISRSKKGTPVYTCDTCRPMKTFTRAEHLR